MYETEKLKILQSVLGNYHKSGDEFLFYCRKCDHNKRKLSLNIEKNVFKCWICDFRGSNISRLIKKYGNFLQRQEWERFAEVLDLSLSLEELFSNNKDDEEQEISLRLPDEFISLANHNLPLSSLEPKNYLLKRGVTKQDILRWKIGYCKGGEYDGRVIIPSFNLAGNVNYFAARSYGKSWPSYKNPNVSKDIVFNELYVDFKNDLVIVEGIFDAIKAENSVPILGNSLREDSKLFQEIVKFDTTVYLALDPDAEIKSMQLIKNLLLYGIEVYKVDVSGFKDVGEMTKEQFLQRKEKAIPITNDDYLMSFCAAF